MRLELYHIHITFISQKSYGIDNAQEIYAKIS